MTVSRFFAVLFMLAAVGFLNGAAIDEVCEEPADIPTKVCINQTPGHISYQENMLVELNKNKELIVSLKLESLEDFKPIITGDLTNNCMAETRIETPYMIKDNNSALHYVVQSATFEQRIKVTRCKNLYSSCLGSIYSSNNDNNVKASCREKTGAVSVYVYDPAQRKLVYKSFELPVCCSCMLKKRF